MPRPQFSLKTLFWLTLVVAAFFGDFRHLAGGERISIIDGLPRRGRSSIG